MSLSMGAGTSVFETILYGAATLSLAWIIGVSESRYLVSLAVVASVMFLVRVRRYRIQASRSSS